MIRAHTSSNDIIPKNQSSFEYHLSTAHAIHKVLTEINTHLHNKQMIGADLIDLEKAFDSMWVNGLLYKLMKLKFPTDLTQIIWSMTRNRIFHTYNGTSTSSFSFHLTEGLMQGMVNSPILFNIYN